MATRKPDKKVAIGGISGTVLGLVSAVLMAVFHTHLPIALVSVLPAVSGVLGHFAGSYMSPYSAFVLDALKAMQAK